MCFERRGLLPLQAGYRREHQGRILRFRACDCLVAFDGSSPRPAAPAARPAGLRLGEEHTSAEVERSNVEARMPSADDLLYLNFADDSYVFCPARGSVMDVISVL